MESGIGVSLEGFLEEGALMELALHYLGGQRGGG
jgi:hypothetical protein